MSCLKSSGGPTASQSTGGRSNSAEPAANPSAGSANAETAIAPAPWAVRVMNRRRVTVSPSNAPGIPRSRVYLLLGSLRPSAMREENNIDAERVGTGTPSGGQRAGAAARSAAAAPASPARAAALAAPSSGPLPCPTAATPAAQMAPGALGVALGVGLRGQRDHVGQLGNRVEVAQLGQPREPERVQAVAREQREVGVLGPHDAAVP